MSENVQALVERLRRTCYCTVGTGESCLQCEAEDAIVRLQADRDAQVREAFNHGFEGGLIRAVEKKHAPSMAEACAAYLATRQPKEPA